MNFSLLDRFVDHIKQVLVVNYETLDKYRKLLEDKRLPEHIKNKSAAHHILPIAKLFQLVSAEEFVAVFNFELAQTKAFLLSFSPRKSYVKKVLWLLDVQESIENNLMNRSSFVIREYLNRCQETNFNISFVQAVEREVNSIIAEYEVFHDLRRLKKRFYFSLDNLVLLYDI
jgi:hypothetical protein